MSLSRKPSSNGKMSGRSTIRAEMKNASEDIDLIIEIMFSYQLISLQTNVP